MEKKMLLHDLYSEYSVKCVDLIRERNTEAYQRTSIIRDLLFISYILESETNLDGSQKDFLLNQLKDIENCSLWKEK